jgi:two-component system sensor histidine kinase/response regulator
MKEGQDETRRLLRRIEQLELEQVAQAARHAEEQAQRLIEQQRLIESAREDARGAVEQLQLATRLSNVVVWSVDLNEGSLAGATTASVNLGESLGYLAEEIPADLSSALELLILPEDRPRLLAEVQAYLDGRSEKLEVEFRVRRKGGSVEWQLARGVAIRDADGRPTRFMGASVFVTRIKQAEAELRAMSEMFDLAMEHFDLRLTELDLRGTASPPKPISNGSENGKARSVRSMTVASYLDFVRQVVIPEDLPRALELLESAFRGELPEVVMECRQWTPARDGFCWRLGRVKVYFDEHGAPERCLSFSYDIQQLKASEEEARRAAEQLRLATELSGVSLWGFDLSDVSDVSDLGGLVAPKWLFADRILAELGYDEGEVPRDLVGRVEMIYAPEDKPRVHEAVKRCLAGSSPQFEVAYRLLKKNGEIVWRRSRGIVTRDASGRPLTFMGTAVDITQLKRTQEELERVKDRLEFALRASNTATWDLETPDGLITGGVPVFHNAWEQCGYEAPRDPLLAAQVLSVLLPPGDGERFMADVQAFFDSPGCEFEIEQRVLHKDGTERWHLKRGVVARNLEGRVTRFSGTSVDITDRKRIERELERVKERLELALRGSRTCTWDFDVPDGQIANAISVYTNAWALCGFDVPAEPQPASEVLSAMLSAEDLGPFTERVQAVFDGTGTDWEIEQRVRHKDQTARWLLGRGVVLRNENGSVTRFIGTALDITDRKLIERALSESEERFRRTFENAAVGMILTDLEGKFLEYNRRFCEFLGYSAEELVDRRVFEFMDPDEAVLHLENQHSVARDETPSFSRDARYFRGDGAVVWGNLTLSVIQRHADGTPVHVMGIMQDITERKALEAGIRDGRETLELAMRGSDISVAVVDVPEGDLSASQWTVFNFWEPMGIDLATAPADFEGWSRLSIHPDDYDAVLGDFRTVAESRRPDWYIEHRFLHTDGSVRWRLSRGTLLYDDAGNVSRFLATASDITRLKQIESELSRAREAAEAANRAKDEFLANVSHEIRTPMNAILGMTELALDSAPSDHQRQLMSTVRSAAKNLLGVINDLLDFSKIAAGKLTLDRATFSVRATVGDTLRALSVRAQRKGLGLSCHVQPEVPAALDGDAGRLRQVLMNLVGNAIKFTHRGEVEVEVGRASRASPEGQDVELVFSISDTGIGIAPEKQATIFQAFEQGDSSTTRNYGGTGLGLTISAQLVALMSGSITVESVLGHGSKFCFTARFTRSTLSEGSTTAPERLSDLRVLIADDDATDRRVLEEWLTSWRMQPTAVGDTASVMAALARGQELGTPFELVLLDARMRDVEEACLAGRIRKQWGERAPRLVLLSSARDPALLARSSVTGVLAHLLKPVRQAELLEAIWGVMNLDLTSPNEQAKSGESAERLPPLNFLVAEDNDLNVALLDELLRQRGHHPQFARDGRAALDLALELAPEAAYDLMLMDLHMPGLDGFQVARAIREDEQGTTRHLPIVALTARSSAHDRERCIAAGMDEFLSKPIEAAALWAAVERVVRRWPPARGAAPQVEAGLLDAHAILSACDGEASLLAKILVVFRESLPNHLARVRSALAAGDFASLHEAAHGLAGTVGIFSPLTANVALTLEDAAEGQELECCAALIERLASMCHALLLETATLSIDSLKT